MIPPPPLLLTAFAAASFLASYLAVRIFFRLLDLCLPLGEPLPWGPDCFVRERADRRPRYPVRHAPTFDGAPVAFRTGTSEGFKDILFPLRDRSGCYRLVDCRLGLN